MGASLGDRPQALEAARTLFDSYPDNVDYGLNLATQQFSRGMRQEARETLDKLRALPTPLSDDPRIEVQTAFQANTRANTNVRATRRPPPKRKPMQSAREHWWPMPCSSAALRWTAWVTLLAPCNCSTVRERRRWRRGIAAERGRLSW